MNILPSNTTKSEVSAPPVKLSTRRKASDTRAVDASLTSFGSLDLNQDHSKNNSATSIIVKSSSVARRSPSTLPTPAAGTRTRVKSSSDLKTLPDEDATAVLRKPRRSRSSDDADYMIATNATNRSFSKNRRIELEELEEMDRRLKMRSLGRTIKISSFRNMFTAETDDRISACLNRAKEIEQELKDKIEKEGEEKIHRRGSGDGKPTHRRPVKSARPTSNKTTPPSSTPPVRPSRRTSSASAAAAAHVVDNEESGLESSLSSLKESRPCILQLPASRDVSPLGNEDHLLLEATAKNHNHSMNQSKRRSSSDGIPKRGSSNDAERPIMRRPSNDGGDRPKRRSSHDGIPGRAKTSRRTRRSSKESTPLAKSDRSNKRSSSKDGAPAAAEGPRRQSSNDGGPVADDHPRRRGASEDLNPRRTARGGVDAPLGRKGTGVTAPSRNSNKNAVASRSQEPVVEYGEESNKSTLDQKRQSNDSSDGDARPRRRRSSTTTPTRKSCDVENPVKIKGKKLLTKNSTPSDKDKKELHRQQLKQDARSTNDSDSTFPNLGTTGDDEVEELETTDAKPRKKFIPGEKSHRRWFGRSNSDPAIRDMTVLIEEQAALVGRQATLNKNQEKKGIWSRFSRQ